MELRDGTDSATDELDGVIEFGGVFHFTNPTKEDFSFFWNNKEYPFKALSTTPMIIRGETLENIQEIRKKAAYKLASREFYNGKIYKDMVKAGNRANGIPSTFDEKILEPMIQQCLKPLPMQKAVVKEVKKIMSDKSFKGSKAITDKDNPNFVFKDETVNEVGKMPDSEI